MLAFPESEPRADHPEPETEGSPRYSTAALERTSPARVAAEQFVRAAYLHRYGARVHSFMPTLLTLRRGQDLCGVVGYRCADREPLYLEQYLDRPVEAELAGHLGEPVSRARIVEVGNFAGSGCRAGRHLVTLLPQYLTGHGLTWVVFTATSLIRDILASVGAPVLELCPADRRRVTAGDEWGDYYSADPRVMAGYLPGALGLVPRRLRRR